VCAWGEMVKNGVVNSQYHINQVKICHIVKTRNCKKCGVWKLKGVKLNRICTL
jgi:hypothetical protein